MPTDMHQLPREEFIERNLGLVHACAGRFKGRGIEYEELYAAGCLGLVKACDGFDTGRGVCFSTYAVPVILGEIKKLFRDGGTVKVSRSLKELSLKINAERERCLKRTGQEPGVTELAETLGTTPEQIALAIRAALPTLSLTPVDDEDGLREFDVPVESPEEALSDRIGLAEVMDRLDSGDRQLIRLRFFAGRTQSETARVLGTTQVQISRRERRILKWMREQLFETNDRRSLDEIVHWLMENGYLPSFCTACYRAGRTGDRFMEFAKDGSIAAYCQANAIMTIKEYMCDYACPSTKKAGDILIASELPKIENEKIHKACVKRLERIEEGERDFRF